MSEDAPISLRLDLSLYGIEEVDRGICEDSYENRSILRANRINWQLIFDEQGEPTGNILALSREMSEAQSLSSLDTKKFLLVDERNKNSDFLTEEALILEERADTVIAPWVIAATRQWIRIRDDREAKPDEAHKISPMHVGPPGRCRFIKVDGVRCQKWHTGRSTDDELCRIHLGARHNNVIGAVARARARAYQAAPTAIQILESLMESAESEPVKLKAATEILDRAGVRGGIEIDGKLELEVKPASEILLERLEKLRPSNQLPILDVLSVEVAPAEPEPEPDSEPELEPATAEEIKMERSES
jgi:hypothetical protein